MAGNITPDEIKLLDIFVKFIVPTATFIIGFFVSRFTMSKKERKDYEVQLLETSRSLLLDQSEAYEEFAKAIHNYANKKTEPDLDDFFSISTKGEIYFNCMRVTCDAIIAKKVDEDSITNSIFPKIKEAVERTLPDFYNTLLEIAKKEGIKYTGEFKRENYESLYTVYETHA